MAVLQMKEESEKRWKSRKEGENRNAQDGKGAVANDGAPDAAEVARDVLDVVSPLLVVKDLLPERTRLNKVGLGDSREVGDGRTGELLVVLGELVGVLLVGEGLDRRGVVGAVALVVEGHRSVALEVSDGVDRRVHRKLTIVNSEAVAKKKGRPQSARLRR
jgi:hypothetical protein